MITLALANAAPKNVAPNLSANAAFVMPAKELKFLERWYQKLGPRKPSEGFGDLVARAAMLQLGKPYNNPPTPVGPEVLVARLQDFQCVSLIESSIAVARCVWLGTTDDSCFINELIQLRYRDGILSGFASKLHYFDEWISDNDRRGILRDVSQELQGTLKSRHNDYITTHKSAYPPIQDPLINAQMLEIEARLSNNQVYMIDRASIKNAQKDFNSGDVLAIAGNNKNTLIIHAALVYKDSQNRSRILHASSYQKKVVLGGGNVGDYIRRRPERLGVMVARPLAPQSANLPSAP